MKTLKLLFVIALVLFTSCSSSSDEIIDEMETEDFITFSIAYDASTNSINVDNKGWFDSIDFETFTSFETFTQGGAEFGVLETYSNNTIKVVSTDYDLLSVTTDEVFTDYDLIDGDLIISVPELRDYIENVGDIFYFDVQVELN